MRPLFLNFPADAACWDIADQFLLGDDLLVAPVVTEGATEREVYLPAGANWRDAWTGALVPGGQWLTAAAPLEIIPVYVRDGGSIGPFGSPGRFGGAG
jgi:alpha-D-xyloside xylohydrolase